MPSIFTLRLRALPRIDEIKALRRMLKDLLRKYKFRCLSVSQSDGAEQLKDGPDVSGQISKRGK
jgi:hypothetical protein